MERRLAGLGFGCVLLLLGCGESEQNPSTTVNGTSGSSGAGGSAGSVSLELGGSAGSATGGGGASAGGGGGGAGLHVCGGPPEPSCPEKSVLGNLSVSDDTVNTVDVEGVTYIGGDLRVSTPVVLDKLSCLEKVAGSITLDFFAEEEHATLWGLRNLKSVGSRVDIRGGERLDVDCGLTRLTSVGTDVLTGGAIDVRGALWGHLDFSNLKVVQHIRIEETPLSKVTLPSNTTLTLGQLGFIRNDQLSEVAGFSGNTFVNDGFVVEGAYSVKITDNPLLSDCRAQQLAQLLVAAGAPESGVVIMNNLPCLVQR